MAQGVEHCVELRTVAGGQHKPQVKAVTGAGVVVVDLGVLIDLCGHGL